MLIRVSLIDSMKATEAAVRALVTCRHFCDDTISRRRSRPAAPWASWCPQSYVYLVLLVLSSTTTTTMSAPVPTPAPKWVNPCGIDPGQVIDSDEVTIPPLKHSMLYSNIALQAKLAKEQADSVSPVFVKESFKDENFPEYSRDLSYKWLPQIPVITDDLKANISPETALNDSYTYLQYYAVGIEQILQDQILYDGTFLEQFRLMEGKLRQVLCELQLAMIEMKIKQNADVQRDVMKQEFRDMDSKTARDLRDWIILRDYIGALDFISTIFEHLKEVAEKNQN